jgi:type IV pilus assembly protein PilA
MLTGKMKKKNPSIFGYSQTNNHGFNLLELMIVVAILGILSAIAIPNFIHYQLQAKTTESKNNLSAISKNEVVYKAEMDGYVAIAPTPANATPEKTSWIIVPAAGLIAGGGIGSFEDIGFRPVSTVYYTYAVAVGSNSTGKPNQEATIDATADLDGNGTQGLFASALANRVPALPGAQSGGAVPSTTVAIENLSPDNF